MKVKNNQTQRTTICIYECKSSNPVRGSRKTLSIYETTSLEVFGIVQAAIKNYIDKTDTKHDGEKKIR